MYLGGEGGGVGSFDGRASKWTLNGTGMEKVSFFQSYQFKLNLSLVQQSWKKKYSPFIVRWEIQTLVTETKHLAESTQQIHDNDVQKNVPATPTDTTGYIQGVTDELDWQKD